MILHSEFSADTGLEEHFFAAESRRGRNFQAEAGDLLQQYAASCAEFGCSPDTEIFLRFHLSDVTNQAPFLKKMLERYMHIRSLLMQRWSFLMQ